MKGFTFKQLITICAVLALIACVTASGVLISHGYPPAASAETEDWSGHSEFASSGSVQTTGTATIASGVVANGANPAMSLQIKSVTLAGATAGNYVFFSGTTVTGANQIGNFYLAANSPVSYPVSAFRGKLLRTLRQGDAITCVGPGILTWSAVVRQDTNNP